MPSRCTAKYIRGFFQEGEMPEGGWCVRVTLSRFTRGIALRETRRVENERIRSLNETLVALMVFGA
jgi:hypothetical protein